MKFKLLFVPLAVLGLAVGSYASCSKNEILKLIDNGFSKSEIKGICNKSESKPKGLSWVTPSNKTCKANGGRIDKNGICQAEWLQAKDICSALSARLPTIYELRKVIVDCGGVLNNSDNLDNKNNVKNSSYQFCYKKKGFNYGHYWSSNINLSNVFGIYFYYANDGQYNKTSKFCVRCIKE